MILVTGGCGFIGSHLVEELVRRKYSVLIVDDLSNGKIKNIETVYNKVQLEVLDISKPAFASISELYKLDAIIHLACHPRSMSFDNPLRDTLVNSCGTVNVLEIARKQKCKVIFSSNSGIYNCTQNKIVDELTPDNPKTPYDVNKLASENLIKIYNNSFGILYTIFRFATVYGERQSYSENWKPVIVEFTKRLLNNESPIIYGNGKQTRDFIYVKDIVNALLLALEKNVNDFMILSTNTSVSILDLLNELQKLTEKKIAPKFEPERLGEIKYMRYDNFKAKRLLGWEPKVSFEDGLKRTVNWIKGGN